MNVELRKKATISLRYFFKLMNNSVFGKAMENKRKQRGIKLVITEERRKYWLSHQIILLQIIYRKSVCHRNEKNSNIYE